MRWMSRLPRNTEESESKIVNVNWRVIYFSRIRLAGRKSVM